jgi:4-aminobutyrate aminotransferase/(S)-3-amino-2-methylpropionate transaminase
MLTVTFGEFYRPDHSYRIFNTWMGEPSKIQVLKKVIDVIRRDNLLQNVQETGDILLKGLKDLQVNQFKK